MSLRELHDYLNNQGIATRIIDERIIRVEHGALPIHLLVELRDNQYIYISIGYGEDLQDILEELYESGEDIEEVVEEALSYLSEVSLKIRRWAESRKFITVFKLKEGIAELLDMVEELKQELGE